MAKTIVAAFDFDGTLTRCDSLPHFLLFATGMAGFAWRALPAIPATVGYKLRLIQNHAAKEQLLKCVLGGKSLANLADVGRRFAHQKLPGLLDPNAVARLNWHRQEGHRCILVSASLDVYLRHWAQSTGFDGLVCSVLATDAQGRVTGRLDGGNCFGPEKRRRLLGLLGDRSATLLYAYGDSRGDHEFLAEADFPFFRMQPCPRVR